MVIVNLSVVLDKCRESRVTAQSYNRMGNQNADSDRKESNIERKF